MQAYAFRVVSLLQFFCTPFCSLPCILHDVTVSFPFIYKPYILRDVQLQRSSLWTLTTLLLLPHLSAQIFPFQLHTLAKTHTRTKQQA
jgi:hypothetical protein